MWTDKELIENLRLYKALIDKQTRGPLTPLQKEKLAKLHERIQPIDVMAFLLKHIENQDMKIELLNKRQGKVH